MLIGTNKVVSSTTAWAGGHGLDAAAAPIALSTAPVLSVMPSQASVRAGDALTVTVWVTTDVEIDGAAAYVDYDPTVLRVKGIVGGSVLTDTIQSGYDNSAGEVNYAAGRLEGDPPSSEFVLVTFELEALAEGVSELSLVTTSDGQGTSRWSDVTYAGSSLFPTLQGAVVTVLAATGGSPDPPTSTSTATSTATPTASPTATPTPTSTATFRATATQLAPTMTHTPTATPGTPAPTPTASSVPPAATSAPGSIEGSVFEDLNGNGAPDSGEAGIAGVAVRFGNGRVVETDVNGGYRISGLTPASYKIVIGMPLGYVAAGPTSRTVYVGSGGSALANFALLVQGTIQGVVFVDQNGNGVQDSGEPGIGGVVVSRVGDDSVTTANNGSYRFDAVTPSSHLVRVTVPTGYVALDAATRTVHVGNDGAAQASFRLQRQGVVQGVVFEDRNGNSVQDAGENGVGGVAVHLSPGISTTTDNVGGYRFAAILPGTYVIDINVPGGYVAGGLIERTVNVGLTSTPLVNFALQKRRVVFGAVFEDVNGNGTQEFGEPGIGGVRVSLSGFGKAATTITGAYEFSDVPPGAYTVQIALPPGFSPATLVSLPVGVGANSSSVANFGLQAQGVVQGFVYEETNGNGQRDAGEFGIGGVAVTLGRADGTSSSRTTSDTLGGFRFDDVEFGDYRVRISVPSGTTSLDAIDVPVAVTSGGSEMPTFPLQTPGYVFGAVFEDLNANGLRDSAEQGVAEVAIQLAGPAGVVDQMTSQGGEFLFGSLSAGLYTVTVGPLSDRGYDLIGAQNQVVILPTGVGGASAAALFPVLPTSCIVGTALSGSLLELSTDSASVTEDARISTQASSLGLFQFGRVAPGDYRILVTPPPGFTALEPSIPVAFSGAGMFVAVETVANGAIAGVVYEDLDGNGLMTLGELGIGGAGVRLIAGDQTVMETVTTANGQYRFGELSVGTYSLAVESTHTIQRGPVEVTLTAERPGANVPLAMARRLAISGQVFWRDLDGNDRLMESGLANMLVTLRQRSDGPVWRSALTNMRGFYRLDGLSAGTYGVEVVSPDGFTLHSEAVRTVELTMDSPGNGQNFVFRRSGVAQADGRLYLPTVRR